MEEKDIKELQEKAKEFARDYAKVEDMLELSKIFAYENERGLPIKEALDGRGYILGVDD